MITIEKVETYGWGPAIRGMRNPMNSWEKSDSFFNLRCDDMSCENCPARDHNHDDLDCVESLLVHGCDIGPEDHRLMMSLAKGGPVHAKYRRMITVYLDITAPLYWWKEFDTYKVGTVANSCSTMHKIHAKEFTLDDFSHEHLLPRTMKRLIDDIEELNLWRYIYLNGGMIDLDDGTARVFQPKDKDAWWQMIQLLPSSYNQKRTIMLNYEVLHGIYHSRRHHKLDEWHTFCDWVEKLPYSEIIIGEKEPDHA